MTMINIISIRSTVPSRLCENYSVQQNWMKRQAAKHLLAADHRRLLLTSLTWNAPFYEVHVHVSVVILQGLVELFYPSVIVILKFVKRHSKAIGLFTKSVHN